MNHLTPKQQKKYEQRFKVYQSLDPNVVALLVKIYQHRVINVKEAKRRYLPTLSDSEFYQQLADMQQKKWLKLYHTNGYEDNEFTDIFGIQLQPEGLELVKIALDISDNITDEKNIILYRHHYKASELKVEGNQLNKYLDYHQFLFPLLDTLEAHQINHRYYDRIHIPKELKWSDADGLLIIDDYEFHLHWVTRKPDRIKGLAKNQYRSHYLFETEEAKEFPIDCRPYKLNEETCFQHERKVVSFFITHEEASVSGYRHYFYKALKPCLNPRFDALSLPPDQVFKAIQQRIESIYAPLEQALRPLQVDVRPGIINPSARARQYDYCLEAKNPQTGENRFFMLMDFRGLGSYAVKMMDIHGGESNQFYKVMGYRVLCVVLMDNVELSEELIRNMEANGQKYVVFTTFDRLKEAKTFEEALIFYDVENNIIPFSKHKTKIDY